MTAPPRAPSSTPAVAVLAVLVPSFAAWERAIREVAAMEMKRSGCEAESAIAPAGPSDASAITDDVRPTIATSMRDISGPAMYIPKAGMAKVKHSRSVGAAG